MIKSFGVVGAGTMGNGIAQTAARAGLSVVMRDVTDEFIKRGLSTIDKSLQRDVDKQRLAPQEKQEIISRINPTTELADLSNCDFVVEAITEDLAVKSDVISQLDRIVKPEVILASNTSSISITRLAAVTSRPDRFIGMHFMNPVPVMKLVEVIRGIATSDETYQSDARACRGDGEDTGRGERCAGFCFKSRVDADDQRSDIRALRRRGHCRSDRSNNETGHESSDGPASACRFYWSGCLPRHYECAI